MESTGSLSISKKNKNFVENTIEKNEDEESIEKPNKGNNKKSNTKKYKEKNAIKKLESTKENNKNCSTSIGLGSLVVINSGLPKALDFISAKGIVKCQLLPAFFQSKSTGGKVELLRFSLRCSLYNLTCFILIYFYLYIFQFSSASNASNSNG